LHAGEFYAGRDPRPFFDALQDANLPVQVELLGRQTESICDFPSEIRQRGLENIVKLIGQVPYAEAIERMSRADILLLVHTPDYKIGVPAKLYEYLGAGRPILALADPDSDVAWVLRESKVLHRIALPRDVPRIRQALVELVSDVSAGRPAVPDKDALAQFTRERMAQRVAACLDSCFKVGTP
jgi:glycosyltransferase involved in cell wall biosynthesis